MECGRAWVMLIFLCSSTGKLRRYLVFAAKSDFAATTTCTISTLPQPLAECSAVHPSLLNNEIYEGGEGEGRVAVQLCSHKSRLEHTREFVCSRPCSRQEASAAIHRSRNFFVQES